MDRNPSTGAGAKTDLRKQMRRLLAFIWAVMKHGWTLLATLLGSVILTVPGWIDPLLSEAHAKELTKALTISPHSYRYLAITFFISGLLFASFLAWNEERESIELLTKELARTKDSRPGILTNFIRDSPRLPGQDRSARATETMAREMRRQNLPEVLVILRDKTIGIVHERLRFDFAFELRNLGADTSLHDWRVIVETNNGQVFTGDSLSKDDKPAAALNFLKEKKCVNLAVSSEMPRGRRLYGWIACEIARPTIPVAQVNVEVLDHLDNPVEFAGLPLLVRTLTK